MSARRATLAPEITEAFRNFSKQVFAEGALDEKTKQIVAVAVAHVTQCPYCIKGHTKQAALKLMTMPPMENNEERRVSGLTIRIERDLCAATQNCIRVAPEVFILGDDHVVTFVAEPVDIEQDRLIEACAVCPTEALIAINEFGEQLVP